MSTSPGTAQGPSPQGTERVRGQNLSRILTLLHRQGPLSRAELTRLCGFNRSTVGALVSELAQLGLAYETEPAAARRVGRPSPLVHANENVAAIAVHPDVDAVTVGLVGLGGKVHRRIRYDAGSLPTVADTVSISRSVVEGMSSELAAMTLIAGIGAAVPALVNSNDGTVLLAPHLNWSDEPLAAELSAGLGLPARAANDANLGSLAESLFGAAVGESDVVYLNGSASGIGGGALVGGVPLRGATGYAGELGHTVVNDAGSLCHCGRRGCLETEVSLSRLLAILGLEHADQDQLEASMAGNSSPELVAESHRQLDLLAAALTDFVNIFNPGVIVLGGFLGVLHSFVPGRLEAAVADGAIGGLGAEVRIRRAALGSELLLVGAAELVFAGLLADPSSAGALPAGVQAWLPASAGEVLPASAGEAVEVPASARGHRTD
ncbi:ROK family protein [Arthrobacter jiangjiafuii]|uniref:ROK family protein n=1 Tax=Arthrobacter jiangjiafuii TaxID=2817475 RepID=A0A975R1S0_9MICC|nr:ROK family transcriptional regulator [Arthrobacter jiangjiafuii]MBP3043730.1 ROK family transcriptional regulator [Arthrobacter jiangjiafuii]QWC10759.1 ROK family protein [Arthrobacter jiangjiafuii]